MVIRDLRILKAFERRFNLVFDRKYRYCIGARCNHLPLVFEYKGEKYKLEYFSGCFNPYLVKIN